MSTSNGNRLRLQGKVLLLFTDETTLNGPPELVTNEHAIAVESAKEGAAVVIASPSLAYAEAISSAVREEGGRAEPVVCDTTNERSFRNAIAAAVAKFGSLHLVVNAIGTADLSNVLDLPVEEFSRRLRSNIGGQFLGIRSALPEIVRSGGGAIVNVSSLSALRCGGAGIAYETSKSGVIALTRHTAIGCAARNIRVNSILPGVINSRSFRALVGAEGDTFAQRVPLGRLATPWEFAKVIVFLLSDDSSYVTGTTLVMDGGLGIPL